MATRLPDDEAERLAALRDHRILDTAPQEEFDDLVRLAADICGVPIAAVSLIDEHRQWFKAITGLEIAETPRGHAFCAHTILQSDLLVVPDAQADPRFADNPLVTGDPGIRFYAGMPLRTEEGYALGALYVIDTTPRQLTPALEATLRLLARQASGHLRAARRMAERERLLLEKERLADERERTEEALRESRQFIESIADQSNSVIFVFDLETMANVYSSRHMTEFLGYSTEQVQAMGGDLPASLLHPDDLPRIQAHFGQFAETADGEVVEVEYRARHAGGEWRWIWNRETVFKRHPDGTARQILGTAYDVTERRQAQEEGVRMAALVESSRDAILSATLDGILVSWNAAAEQLYGYTAAEIIGRHASILVPPSERRFTADITEAIRRDERRENMEVKRRRKDGTWLDVSVTFSPIKNAAGEITATAAIARDITAQKRAAEALRQSEEALRAVLESAPVILYAADAAGTVTLSEGTGLAALGLLPGEAVGRSVFEFSGGGPETEAHTRRALAGEDLSFDAQIDGLCLHTELRPLRDLAGALTGIIGVCFDVTERKQAEQSLKDFSVVLEFQKQELEKANAELARLAARDGLTGLLNRRAFDSRLKEEFERASRYHKPLSLLLLDIDGFKQYNDRFGHLAGDEALRRIGRILEKATRETDFVARYGGEELAVILPETDGDGAMQVAERVRRAVATAPWDHCEITASLGVCTLRLEMTRPEEMVSCADRALYQSKAEGRNRVTHGHDFVAGRGANAEALGLMRKRSG